MKSIISIICLLTIPLISFAQLLDTPTKKSNTIVIILKDTSPDDAFRKCANAFQDEGWTIENSDAVLYSMNTDFKKAKGFFVYEWGVYASVRKQDADAHVYLRGKRKQDTAGTNGVFGNDKYLYNDIEKRTNAGKDWKEMVRVAKTIGDELRYK